MSWLLAEALETWHVGEKHIVIVHDESTFQANDDMWGQKGNHVIKPKSRGAGIMVSDETNGYLKLTNEEYEKAKQQHPRLRQQLSSGVSRVW